MPPKIDQPNSGVGLCPTELPLVSQYAAYGYGSYTYGPGLEVAKRYDIMSPEIQPRIPYPPLTPGEFLHHVRHPHHR